MENIILKFLSLNEVKWGHFGPLGEFLETI